MRGFRFGVRSVSENGSDPTRDDVAVAAAGQRPTLLQLQWSIRFALHLPPQLAGQRAHRIVGVRTMQQADFVVVDHRQVALTIDDAMIAGDRAAGQQADADAIGHGTLDAPATSW